MWKKLAIVIVPAAILIAIGVFLISSRRRATTPTVVHKHPVSTTASAAAKLRSAPNVTDLKSAQQLVGMPVWMQDGYVFHYFPYHHNRVDYGRPVGLVPPMEQMKIEKVVTQRKPRRVKTHVPGGAEQVLAVFTLPGKQETYALPIGYREGKMFDFYSGQMFYFNDPHQIYAYWPKSAWDAISKHQVVQGMSELQAEAALGANQKVETGKNDVQRITYDTGTQKWTVTFKNNKAVEVKKS